MGGISELSVFRIAFSIECDEIREEYLQQACGENRALYDRVAELLQANEEHPQFLESPPTEVGSTLNTLAVTEKPGDTIGPYTLVEQIGEGGMGVVYRARQTEPIKRSVALKVIKPGMDSETVIGRFQAERQALALMDHPSIAHVLDAGTTDSGRPFFVMELVKGIPITDYCDGCNYSTRDRLELFVRVCQAVNHAHDQGIIHRDIKPSNVLIEMRDGEPSPKVIDFGVAKAMGRRLTEHTLTTGFAQMVGTPLYMSPEQAEMSPVDVDVRSDVYALGVLLYQLLIGTPPFDEQRLRSSSFDELRRIIREEDPPKPSTRLSTLGAVAETIAEHRRTQPHRLQRLLRGDLDWIVMKALEKDPRHRYVSANALAADVQRYLDDRPTLARPPSLTGRAIKWSRRHTGLLMSSAVILLVSTIALAISAAAILSAYQRESSALISEAEARRGETVALQRATESLRDAQKQRDLAERRTLEARRASYVSDMRFAYRQWDQGLLCDLRTLLDAQIPEEGLNDLRGLEWHLLSAQVDSRYQPIGRHDGPVPDVDVFPDGHTFATAGEDGVVRVWDADSLSMLREFDLQDKPVYTVGVSPDGQWLAYGAGSRDSPELKPVTLIDAQTGAVLGTTNWHDTTIRQARFSPDGRFLASGSLQEKVTIWEFTDRVRGRSYDLTEPYADPENFEIQFLDNRLLLTEFHERTGYRVWDVETKEAVRDYPGLCQWNVRVATWCQPHPLLAYVPRFSDTHEHPERYNAVHLLDTTSGNNIGRFDVGEDTVSCMDFDPHSNTLYVGTGNGQIHAKRMSLSGEASLEPSIDVTGAPPQQAHYGSVSRVRALDESRVVSTGGDGRVVVLRPDRGEPRASPFGGGEWGLVTHLAASPTTNLTAWAGADGAVRLADRDIGGVLSESRPLSGQPMHLTWSGDGTHLAAISQAGDFACWRIGDHALVECLRGSVEDFSTFEAGLALSHDGSVLYVGGDRGPDGFHVWNVRTQDRMDFVPTLYRVLRLAVSPDDRFLIAAREGIFVFDRESHTQLHYLQQGGVCFTLAFAPDRKTLIAGYRDGVIRLWDVAEGKLLRVLPEYDRVSQATSALMLSADGRTLVAGDAVGRLRFWNTQAWDYLGGMRLFSTTDNLNEPRKIVAMEVAPERQAIDIVYGRDRSNTSRFAQLPLTAD